MNIVVAVDLSPGTQGVLDFAVVLARGLDARLHLVHAIHVPEYVVPAHNWWATLRSRAAKALRVAVDQVEETGLDCEYHLVDEHPVPAILACADEVDARLIVVGTRGLSNLEQALLGSVAEPVIRSASCPVIGVPPTRSADA
jgi:nucleotide-binding universal stress UspA family protein